MPHDRFRSWYKRKKGETSNEGLPFVLAGPVSRVLFPERTPGLCHLSTTAVTCRLQQPTPRHRTSNPSLPVYTVLQPVRRTAADITADAVGSYPAFSPLPVQARAVLFCYVSYDLTTIKPLTWTVLCVARTFLSPVRGSDKASLHRKSTQKMKITGAGCRFFHAMAYLCSVNVKTIPYDGVSTSSRCTAFRA